MAYSSIVKPSVYFNTKLYTGNGGTQSVTGVGFKPDFTWIKNRSRVENNVLYDIVRGVQKRIEANTTDAQSTKTNGLTAFDSDGFTVGSAGQNNYNGDNLVSWNWLAGGSQGSSNTDGSINTTYTSVNTTAGFSISTYTGTGSNATVGHGLGVVPKFILTRHLGNAGRYWGGYHASIGNGSTIALNSNNAIDTNATYWNDTTPTASVFSVGTNGDTNDSSGMVAYCFAEVKGYSKFGKYTGNGNDNGPFIYTGFKPAWIMIKRTDDTDTWTIYDNKRTGFNVDNNQLFASATTAESTDDDLDILSNGFKIKRNSGRVNASGANNIYMAFAAEPLVANSGANGVPATAR
jgi:hypothetical protein